MLESEVVNVLYRLFVVDYLPIINSVNSLFKASNSSV